MRVLPDNPSVDFLRQQAKDLLGAMRETDPTMALAAAQRQVAEQYGCRSWVALREEVDRRRASLPIAPDGLGERLVEAFGLGRLIEPPLPIAFEPMGRTWRLETAEGRWIARPQYQWMSDRQAELGERLRLAGASVGVVSPTARRTQAGDLIATLDGTVWRVEEWMELGPVTTRPASAASARAMGSALARLHGLAIPSEVPFHAYTTHRRPMSTWDELIERARNAGKPWAGQLIALRGDIQNVSSVPSPSFDDPILGNCNISEETVRAGRGGELVITEWGFAGSVTPSLEFAGVLGHWVLRPWINPVGARAFADGYREVAGQLPPLDRSAFLFAIAGWCNWTWNQMCESIDPRDDDHAYFAEHETLTALAHPMTIDTIDRVIDLVTATPAH